jgi:membrane protein DedA with SNARE-associated domain
VSLDRLAEAVLDPGVPPLLIYVLVVLSCVLESFFPPWPTDVITLYAGLLAGRGVLDPTTVVLTAVGGTQLGVMVVFWISRRWGRRLLEGPLGRFLPLGRLDQLERWFDRFGAPAITISRFFPGIRALVMPAAGLARFGAGKVWLYAGASVVVWNLLVVGLGYQAGTHLDWAKGVLMGYNVVAGGAVAAVVVIVGGVVLYRRFWRRLDPTVPGGR